jgi:hypothetical protein
LHEIIASFAAIPNFLRRRALITDWRNGMVGICGVLWYHTFCDRSRKNVSWTQIFKWRKQRNIHRHCNYLVSLLAFQEGISVYVQNFKS